MDLYVRQYSSPPPSLPPPSSSVPPPPRPSENQTCTRKFNNYTKYNNSRIPLLELVQFSLNETVEDAFDQCKENCTANCDCVAFNLVPGYYGDSVCSTKYSVPNISMWEEFEDDDLYVRSVVRSTCVGTGLTDEYLPIADMDSYGGDLDSFKNTDLEIPALTEDVALIHCKEACSANCSCVGFVFSSWSCYMKKTLTATSPATKYDFYKRIVVSPPPPPFPPPLPPPSPPPPSPPSSPPPPTGPKKSNFLLIGIITGSTAVVISLLALLGYCCFQRYRRGEKHDSTRFPLSFLGEKRVVKRIPLLDIVAATNNFNRDNILGEGGYGTVYVGVKEDGEKWAVKRAINASTVSLQTFTQEVDIISQMSHTNIVQLLGYCDEGTEQILVYEFMEKGSLKKLLHDGKGESLTFQQRVEIAIDVAEGLRYLHHYAGATVIHRDIKSDNILVDSKFKSKIADFGLLKDNPATVIDDQVETAGTQGYIKMNSAKHDDLCGKTKIAGTRGYIDPAYLKTSQVSTKSDVYSFGVVLFELITGRKALVRDDSAPEDDPSWDTLVHWIQPHVKNIDSIADPQLGGMYHREALRKLTKLAIICTQKDPENRPTMEDVAQLLAQIRNILLDKQAIDLDDDDEWETADTSPRQFSIIMGSSDSTSTFIVPMSQSAAPR